MLANDNLSVSSAVMKTMGTAQHQKVNRKREGKGEGKREWDIDRMVLENPEQRHNVPVQTHGVKQHMRYTCTPKTYHV